MDPAKKLRDYLRGPPTVTQSELARRVGSCQSTIWRLLHKERGPSYPLARDIERITGIPSDAWFAKRKPRAA